MRRGGNKKENCIFYSSLTIWQSIKRRVWKCDSFVKHFLELGFLIYLSLAIWVASEV